MRRPIGKSLCTAAGGTIAVLAGMSTGPGPGAAEVGLAEGMDRPAAARPAAAAAPPPLQPLRVALEKLERRDGASRADPFAAQSWQPLVRVTPAPPPGAVVALPPAPPPVPRAPPLPFALLGKLSEEGDATVYFLAKGEQLHTVKLGDVIENTYRLDRAAHGYLTLTYLPLDEQQLLPDGQS